MPPLAAHLPAGETLTLGVAGAHQTENAALAVHLAAAWLRAAGHAGAPPVAPSVGGAAAPFMLPPVFKAALQACRWPGRSQVCDSRGALCACSFLFVAFLGITKGSAVDCMQFTLPSGLPLDVGAAQCEGLHFRHGIDAAAGGSKSTRVTCITTLTERTPRKAAR